MGATSRGRLAILQAPIDTTFAIHRGGQPFRRLKKGVRVYHPYEARHLDWYIAPEVSNAYRLASSSNISHWDNEFFIRTFAAAETS